VTAFLGQPVFPEEQPLALPFPPSSLLPLSEQPFSLPDFSLAVIIVIIIKASLGVVIVIIIVVTAFLGQQVFPEEQPPSTSLTA
jgi:hypothetical protein